MALCINEYFAFKTLENESLKETYNKFNQLVNKCRRFAVERSTKDNNLRFPQSLNPDWIHLPMSLQTTLDLESWSLSNLCGSLVSYKIKLA